MADIGPFTANDDDDMIESTNFKFKLLGNTNILDNSNKQTF